ncbi:DUF418 domain-containing protein [Streptomyces vinaceus]|uniref:hypothetical protein n=1 Tax=Streptomyces vinaceus TaxID=1960 RepID=UPI00367EC724
MTPQLPPPGPNVRPESLAPTAAPWLSSNQRRIPDIDALRGFALCGILFVNIPQITGINAALAVDELDPVGVILDHLVHDRFHPIFAYLFGVSFGLLLHSAARRTECPRLALTVRLLGLGAIGIAHHQLQPGEALLPYALIGTFVLVPASFLPRLLVLAAGALGTVAGVTIAGGGIPLIPGLFLLGIATTAYDIPETLEWRGRQLAVLFTVIVPAAACATIWSMRVGYNN